MTKQMVFSFLPLILSLAIGLYVLFRLGNNPRGDATTFILAGVAIALFLSEWYMLVYIRYFYM